MNRWTSDGDSVSAENSQQRPSDLALDAHILQGGSDDKLAPGESARATELRRQSESFRNSVGARELEDHLVRRARRPLASTPARMFTWRHSIPALVPVAALAAIVFVATLNRQEISALGTAEHAAAEAYVGIKGSLVVNATIMRNGVQSPLHSSHELSAGDRVQFEVTVAEPSYVALFGISQDGAVPIVPADGRKPEVLTPGVKTTLNQSAELDGVGNEERFVVVSCPATFDATDLSRKFDTWAKGEVAAEDARMSVPSTCDTIFLRYDKR